MAVDQNNGQIENYEDLLEDYSHFAPPAADEVLQGTVIGITGKDVIIDFGYKSEGLVPIDQFQTPAGAVTVQLGDVVDVMIDQGGEQPEGYVLLSHTRAARLRIWDNHTAVRVHTPGTCRYSRAILPPSPSCETTSILVFAKVTMKADSLTGSIRSAKRFGASTKEPGKLFATIIRNKSGTCWLRIFSSSCFSPCFYSLSRG